VRIDWLRQFSVTIQCRRKQPLERSGKNRFRASLVLPRHYLGGQPKGSGWKIPVIAGFEWCRLSASLSLADSNRLISFTSESGPNPRVQHYRRGLD
jgi:hypothetical protein